jgi:hypothetical protein
VQAPAPAPSTPAVAATPTAPPEADPIAAPPKKAVAETATPRPKTTPPPGDLWKQFSGEKAFAQVKKQVEVGPRPAGSPALAQARTLIHDALKSYGWDVEQQAFTDETPRGPIQFINLIGRFPAANGKPAPSNTQKAIVCSHYDTKRFLTIRFLGACDGGSSTGALVELARVLALDPDLAAKVELVFFDGEEALEQFTATDGLYGSRYYARSLRDGGRAGQFKFGVLMDMIGDSEPAITLPPDSPSSLAQGILASAEIVGVRQDFSFFGRQILDDHVPLITLAKIPSIDLIDFNILYWHTADDTLDKLRPASLQRVGAVVVSYLTRSLH